MKRPPTCLFCGAERVKRTQTYGVWAEYTCGTFKGAKGAKGSKWLWFQTYQCKENAKQSKQ